MQSSLLISVICFVIGQPIDGPNNGQPPTPWSIAAQPAKLFQNSEVKIEVPHTAVVKVGKLWDC